MGFDRNPPFTYGGKVRRPPPEEEDPLTRTYTDLMVILDEESLRPGGPSKAVLNSMAAWMGAAKGRLLALTKAQVAERFPVLEERVRNLRLLAMIQWAAILFLAGLVVRK